MDRGPPWAAAADTPFASERGRPRERTLRLLIALGGERAPVHAMRDAFRFALAVGAEPHVLRVVGAGSARELMPRHMPQRARQEDRLIGAAQHARVLCDEALSEHLPDSRLTARLGPFIEQVMLRAAEVRADLIAISPNRKHLAATVQRLARAANCPILVPRKAGSFATLLAATDLKEPNTPLLRHAARLGRHLDATVVALHGVRDGSSQSEQTSLAQPLLMLERALRRLGGRFESVVLRTGDPAREILLQARQCNADIILIGTRRHAPGTTARVVQSAQHSVLVAPLAERVGREPLAPER